MTYHIAFGLMIQATLVANSVFAAEEQVTWMKLSRDGQAGAFIRTGLTTDGDDLQISHDISIRGGEITANTTVSYSSDGKLSTKVARLDAKKGGVQKKCELTFTDEKIVEKMSYSGPEGDSSVAKEHDREPGEFVHLWSLPEIAPRLLPQPGEVSVLFPEFPNSYKDSGLGSIESCYYRLKRVDDASGKVLFEVIGNRPRQGRECKMTLDAQGKLISIELSRRMRLEPSTEAEANPSPVKQK